MQTRNILDALLKGAAAGTVTACSAVGALNGTVNVIEYASSEFTTCSIRNNFFTTVATFGATFITAAPIWALYFYRRQNQAGRNPEEQSLLENKTTRSMPV